MALALTNVAFASAFANIQKHPNCARWGFAQFVHIMTMFCMLHHCVCSHCMTNRPKHPFSNRAVPGKCTSCDHTSQIIWTLEGRSVLGHSMVTVCVGVTLKIIFEISLNPFDNLGSPFPSDCPREEKILLYIDTQHLK